MEKERECPECKGFGLVFIKRQVLEDGTSVELFGVCPRCKGGEEEQKDLFDGSRVPKH